MYSFFLDSVARKLFAREQSSGNEKRVNFLVFIYTLVYYHSMCGINIGVSVRFRSKELGTRVKDRAKSFLALVSFLARSKPKVPFLGLSLLRNQTETLATQALPNPCTASFQAFSVNVSGKVVA